MLVLMIPSPDQWDAFVAAQPRAHALQESAWGELKRAYGWQVERVALADGNEIVAGGQLLFRPLPFRLGTMAYLGMGPYVTADDQWEALWQAVDACARKCGAAFLKWEPGILTPHPPTPSPTAGRGGEKAPQGTTQMASGDGFVAGIRKYQQSTEGRVQIRP